MPSEAVTFLKLDQLANLGAHFAVAPVFIGEPTGLDQWAWELGQHEREWLEAATVSEVRKGRRE